MIKTIILIILLCNFVFTETEKIDCNGDYYRPYDRRPMFLTIENKDIEFINCKFGINAQLEIKSSTIIFKDCIINDIRNAENSKLKIISVKFGNFITRFEESNVEIEKSTIRSIFLNFIDSKVNIYNSIIYSEHIFHSDEGYLNLYQTRIRNNDLYTGFIRTLDEPYKDINSEPYCDENYINPLSNTGIIYIGDINKWKEENRQIPNYLGCSACPSDQYSSNSKECRECIEGSSWDKKTSSCVPCLYKERCPTAFSCIYPYKGIGCTNCENGYFMLNNDCKKCPSNTDYIIGIIFGFILTILVGFAFYKFTTDWVDELVILTVSITHFQILSIITDFSIKFPDWFKEFLNVVKSFFVDILKNYMINTDCLTNFSYVENYYFFAMLPFIGYIVIVCFIYIWYSIKRKDEQHIINSIIKLTYTLINTMYIYQLSYSLKVINVMPVQDTVVMRDNRDIRVIDKEWKGMMAFAAFYMLYSLIVPGLFYYKNEDKFDFLEKKLKSKFKSYEVIFETYLKKGFISCFMIIPAINVNYSLILATLVGCCLYHWNTEPYRVTYNDENKMVKLFYFLEILYISMEMIYINGGFDVGILSILLGIIYLISFVIIGTQLIPIFYKKFINWKNKRKEKKIEIEIT